MDEISKSPYHPLAAVRKLGNPISTGDSELTGIPKPSLGVQPARGPGQLVYADIAGPFTRSAVGGYQYALVFIDDHTHATNGCTS